MGFFNFPHTRTYDTDLGWLIKELNRVKELLNQYLENAVITFADPITWNITEQYPALTCVIDSDGTAYLSKQPVPAGVDISNTNYWLPIFNYDDNINELRSQIAYNAQNSDTTGAALAVGDLVFWKGLIYRAIADMPAGTAFIVGTNIEKYTVDEKINSSYTTLNTKINSNTASIENINDNIESISEQITEIEEKLDPDNYEYVTPEMYGAVGDGVTDDIGAIRQAIASGFTVLFLHKEYYISQPIELDQEFRTRYIFDASRATIKYTGADYAVKVSKMRYSTLKFGSISAPNGGGIKIYAGEVGSDRCQYIDIYFRVIAANPADDYACIYGLVNNNAASGWLNEIRIHDGHCITGKYGIHIRNNGGYKLDRWAFDGVGFEGIDTGIFFDNVTQNMGEIMVLNCRLQESIGTFIKSVGRVRGIMVVMPTTYTISFNIEPKIDISSNSTGTADYWKIFDTKDGVFYVKNGVIEYDGMPLALTNGVRIGSGNDLNTYTTIGNYFCISNSDAASLTNSPTSSAFRMTVYYTNGAAAGGERRIKQYVENVSGDIYCRNIEENSGTYTYGSWYRILTSRFVETYDSTIPGLTLAAYGSEGSKAITIVGKPETTLTSGQSYTLGQISNARLRPSRQIRTNINCSSSPSEFIYLEISSNGTITLVPRYNITPTGNTLTVYLPLV